MAWLGTISKKDATGDLAATYAAMAARPTPEVYRPRHDDVAGIIRAHSLDAELMRRTFTSSGGMHRLTLDWAERELLSSVAARTNQCFY